MGKINNLSQGNFADIPRQQHRDRYATPLNGSSVGSGGMRFYGTGRLTVENEGLYVTGTANISGVLTVSGKTNLNGPTDVAGAFTVTGPTKLNGKTDIGGNTTVTGTLTTTGAMATKGTLSVEGVTTLKADLNVTSGGKIKVGNMTLDPAAASGAINFANGAQIASASNVLAFYAPGGVDVSVPFRADNTVRMSNLPTVTSTTGMFQVFVKSDGSLCKKAV